MKNCSIYLQNYWIDLDEPTNTTGTCTAAFSLFNALLLSSGSTQGFSTSSNTGATNTSSCLGTHVLRATLRSRTYGRTLSTVSTTYTVTAR